MAPKPFGTPDYGKEELVAEMAAAYLWAEVGITPRVIENQAAYLQGWLKTIKADRMLVIEAASKAKKAADWIRGERGQATE
jgi:antirestriction protein ArdC